MKKSFQAIIILLVVIALGYLSISTIQQLNNPDAVHVAYKAEGYSGYTLKVPASEIDAVFNQANAKIAENNSGYHFWRNFAAVCSWISFFIGAVITLIASLWGQVSSDMTNNLAFLQKTLVKKGKKVVWIAVLGGIATISSGTAVKAKENADDKKSSASKLREAVIGAYKDIQTAQTAIEAKQVLEKLKGAIAD